MNLAKTTLLNRVSRDLLKPSSGNCVRKTHNFHVTQFETEDKRGSLLGNFWETAKKKLEERASPSSSFQYCHTLM